MTMKLVETTQQDIDKAQRNSSRHCAVAEAIQRTIPSAIHVAVDIQTIRYSLRHLRRRFIYLTPRSVIDYIVKFDAGDTIKPFKFKLSEQTKHIIEMKEMTMPDQDRLQKEYSGKRLQSQTNGRRRLVGGKAPRRVTAERVYGVRKLRQNKAE